ncbi:hypothetical protein B0H16DRAFT_1490765 [Mycena metata]|uniref:Uncharacterized protein n=1 Tax=Mycena metata TaxID=1033252 RepID=A0AAD7KJV2_9AGAR|nr:hypothetical protein B0H16DRAFT_1490765 [Mycena metata]
MDPGPSTKLHAPSPRPPIQFPAEIHPVASRPLHNSPVGRSSPLAPNGSAGTSSNGRRRVLSANPGPTMPGYPARSKRAVSSSFGPSAAPSHREAMSSVMEDSGISLFSDEYDLYPQILQDVQRALKLKARREARLKSANSSPSSNKSEHASTSSPQSSPLRPVIPPVPFAPPSSPDIRETQSSPTPGQPAPPVAHPVPSSSDEGTTLDWSSIGADDDRLERRWTMSITKRKDKERPPSNNAVETRETMYAAKIQQMRKKISPAAQQQATLISDQLGRRYNILLNSPPSDGVNILKVARWFGNQEEVVKTSLEQAEPLSWLSDSEEEPKCPSRFPWYLSALIMEEYALQLHGNPKPRSYHERVASLNSSPNLSIISRPPFPSPHGSSYFPLGPSLKRKLSYEGRIYFEPREGRRSIESRKSGESGYSSISLPHALVSPTSANLQPRVDSDIASSRNSLSEHSDDGGRKLRPIIHPAPLSRELLSNSTVKANGDPKPPLSPIPDDRPEKREEAVSVSSSDKISANLPPTATNRTFGLRKVRISLPPKDDFRLQLERKRQEDAAEEAGDSRNSRVRQLLNRVAATVKEYDQAQTSLSNLLHIPHDPAAVDDIHQRLARQRETFQEFISCAATVDHSVIPESVLADPIASLTESLKSLDSERQEVAWRATEVLDVLMRVKNVHAEVKTAYNDTLSHTSVIYPEISTIVDLEESYKDQYQYLWELAMDALTFVLDTVTPFWRTYGRMIGDDVQHFLIIPLYRNEFTGEPKRYNIYTFPRRSFRHWVGLFLFFLATVALAVFQTRAALSSVSNRWLEGIPFVYLRRLLLIPFWVSIIIQWWAVVAELSVVLTQLAVVVWWMGCRISLLHVSCSGYYPGGGGAAAPGVGGKAGLGRIDWA